MRNRFTVRECIQNKTLLHSKNIAISKQTAQKSNRKQFFISSYTRAGPLRHRNASNQFKFFINLVIVCYIYSMIIHWEFVMRFSIQIFFYQSTPAWPLTNRLNFFSKFRFIFAELFKCFRCWLKTYRRRMETEAKTKVVASV